MATITQHLVKHKRHEHHDHEHSSGNVGEDSGTPTVLTVALVIQGNSGGNDTRDEE
jgi:hypothetical protein